MLGGTATIVIISLLERLKLPQPIYGVLIIETTINSVVTVLLFELLLVFLGSPGTGVGAYGYYVLDYLGTGLLVGVAGAMIWLFIRSTLKGARNYLATLAIAFLLYGAVDFLKGAALISILIFAIVMGNAKLVGKYFKLKVPDDEPETDAIKKTIDFVVTTFFFVLIGMIAVFPTGDIIPVVAVLIILVAIRFFEIRAVKWEDPKYSRLAYSMMPRGLTAAILASIFLATGQAYSDYMFGMVLTLIIATNIVASISVNRMAKEIAVKKA